MRKKIVGIITCQILLIVSSYLILVFFENQSTYLGNSINISGKNRFFGELLYQKTINYILTNNQNPPTDIIKNIDNNIKTLSQGGTISEQVMVMPQNQVIVMAVPSKFSDDLGKLANNWSTYKTYVMSEMYSIKNKNILNDQDLESQRSKFITSADQITNDLSNYSKELVGNMTILQITLLGINVTAHILLLRIILRLIREEQTKKILLQQISDKNKELEFESKFALLQKDISQSFIADMEDKLHELNEQVNLMREGKDFEKNNRIVREIFQRLFVKIQQLALSTIELENKTSDYEQLIKKLRDNIFVFSNSNNKLAKVKKSEDLVSVIQSYIDIVNLMIYEQSIPPKLGKNLTDALKEIVEHLMLKTSKP
ncbi:MAG: hypothetical protein KGI28_06780 [Thaumarchaeota archaeon]|nr:hypothetical protein [Nitrososphaerota archaeon]